ncbi:MAG: FAD-dependent oxidoreductase, partial [Chromatiales bacterium]|nr:FAD-dependent oxidoreductase [Chromatiales bacterium]
MTEQVDILVVGGGIHGVGVAQAAAAAGHSVLLVEKSRLAAGTSSRSSKLIHGGLRYLETYQFRLVRECLRERRILLDVAPDLVRLESFHLPVYEGARRAPWLLTVGLGLYTALAGFGRGTGFS